MTRAGHPGFDTRIFPGVAVLQAWKESSPYEWVGYYLPAPCQTGTTWVGQRRALRDMGWGIAVIFIGEQDWRDHAPDSATADTMPGGLQCSTMNLTTAKGATDAARADSAASAEGFVPGSTVFLDVERVDTVSPELSAYVRSWIAGMLRSGRYTPGLYLHERNAAALHAIAAAEYSRAGKSGQPPVWVAYARGFDIDAVPSASGFAFATIWQGLFDVHETWGGATLVIDANVAAAPDPSGQ